MSQSLEFKIPEGYVFDKENSTDEVVRFKPIKKKITYQDVKEKLFPESKASFFLGHDGAIMQTFNIKYLSSELLLSTSQQQLQQIRALNKLMNVAVYLNSNCNEISELPGYWYIYADGKELKAGRWIVSKTSFVSFKLEKLALQAIEILGEEEVKKALGIFE